jgi:hypothetical protein
VTKITTQLVRVPIIERMALFVAMIPAYTSIITQVTDEGIIRIGETPALAIQSQQLKVKFSSQ